MWPLQNQKSEIPSMKYQFQEKGSVLIGSFPYFWSMQNSMCLTFTIFQKSQQKNVFSNYSDYKKRLYLTDWSQEYGFYPVLRGQARLYENVILLILSK